MIPLSSIRVGPCMAISAKSNEVQLRAIPLIIVYMMDNAINGFQEFIADLASIVISNSYLMP